MGPPARTSTAVPWVWHTLLQTCCTTTTGWLQPGFGFDAVVSFPQASLAGKAW